MQALKKFHLSKGLSTPSISIDSRADASIDSWNEYISLNCIIHMKRQRPASTVVSEFKRILELFEHV